MVTRAQVVAEAREWIGTRYQHQAHAKGVATDCGGLVYGVARNLNLVPSIEEVPGAEGFKGYPRHASNGSMLRACNLLLRPIAGNEAQPGDVVLMQFNGEPQHVGILGDYRHGGLSIIHAYAPMRRVVESRLDESFRAGIVGAFGLPNVEG